MLAKDNSMSSHSAMKQLLDPDLGLFRGIERVLSVQTLAFVARGGVPLIRLIWGCGRPGQRTRQ